MADTAAYVDGIEQLLIDVLADLGVEAGRLALHNGVWIDPDGIRPRKIAAIGVRITKGRSMHGFALNVDPDLSWFERIVPCGITDKGVTSLAAEGIDVAMREASRARVDGLAPRVLVFSDFAREGFLPVVRGVPTRLITCCALSDREKPSSSAAAGSGSRPEV